MTDFSIWEKLLKKTDGLSWIQQTSLLQGRANRRQVIGVLWDHQTPLQLMGHFYRTTIGPTLEYEINVGQQKED